MCCFFIKCVHEMDIVTPRRFDRILRLQVLIVVEWEIDHVKSFGVCSCAV